MATAEWLRTFVAIYRSGSVTEGAAQRNLSQPAASQQLQSLERSVGHPLFDPHPARCRPDPVGAGAVRVGGRRPRPARARADRPRTAGSSGRARRPSASVPHPSTSPTGSSPASATDVPALSVRFGPDADLVTLLHHGELDVVVTTTDHARRGLAPALLGTTPFVLVSAPGYLPDPPPVDLGGLGRALAGRDWVAYSAELPRTRRFWQASLGRPVRRQPATGPPPICGPWPGRWPGASGSACSRPTPVPPAWPRATWSRCFRSATWSRPRPGSPSPARPTRSRHQVAAFASEPRACPAEPDGRLRLDRPGTGRPSSR